MWDSNPVLATNGLSAQEFDDSVAVGRVAELILRIMPRTFRPRSRRVLLHSGHAIAAGGVIRESSDEQGAVGAFRQAGDGLVDAGDGRGTCVRRGSAAPCRRSEPFS